MLSEYPQSPTPISQFRNKKYVSKSENQASLWQTNYCIGDSLWNKNSAEFGLHAPKRPSSFLLVPNGHSTG